MGSDSSTSESTNRIRPVGVVVGVLVACAVLFWLLIPGLSPHRESSRRAKCVMNLKLIGVALLTYHDFHKTLPPAFIADENGIPIHSWRVLILPYLEDEELAKLYEEYRFDEPWNGPNNRRLAAEAPHVFRCPSDEENRSETNYLAVVGEQTVWPGTNTMAIPNMGDGTPTTIAVVETAGSGVNWLEPRDLTFHDATQGINRLNSGPAISSRHQGGANVLFSDGAVHFLANAIPLETLRGLLTASGGENAEIPYN